MELVKQECSYVWNFLLWFPFGSLAVFHQILLSEAAQALGMLRELRGNGGHGEVVDIRAPPCPEITAVRNGVGYSMRPGRSVRNGAAHSFSSTASSSSSFLFPSQGWLTMGT